MGGTEALTGAPAAVASQRISLGCFRGRGAPGASAALASTQASKCSGLVPTEPVPSFLPPPAPHCRPGRVASARPPRRARAHRGAHTQARAPPEACAQTPTPRAGRVCGPRRAAGAER